MSELAQDVATDLSRGNLALWIGPVWRDVEQDLNTLSGISWLAVWSDVAGSALLTHLKECWSQDAALSRRAIVEVPARLEDSLGSYFSFAGICPFFFLRGRGPEWQQLPTREQRRARDEQIDEVGRLGASLLLVEGYADAASALTILREEFPPSSTALRVVICGLDTQQQSVLAELLLRDTSTLSARVRVYGGTAASLVREAQQATTALPTFPAIKAGSAFIDVAPALDREDPIDQDFTVLTTFEIALPTADEDRDAIVEQLLANSGPPWRAFAHDLHWQRNAAPVAESLRYLGAIGKTSHVLTLNIPAEPGSGLTVLLSEIAFRCAERGHPTLVRRPSAKEIDYEGLRTFLEFLTASQSDCPPAVLFFDDSDNGFETPTGLRELPLRLARDGRQALIVRGVSIKSFETYDNSFRRQHAVFESGGRVQQVWFETPLKAMLTGAEQASLCVWAAEHWPGTSQSELREVVSSWGADWTSRGDPPPLLTCFYFLLRDHVIHSSALGEHVVERVKRGIKALSAEAPPDTRPSADRRLAPDELIRAVDALRQRFRYGGETSPAKPPSPTDAYKAFIALSVLGALRIPITRTVLTSIVGVPSEQLNRAIVLLEQADITKVLFDPLRDETYGIWGRDAFYTRSETIGLRHPSYGRLALEWLRSERGSDDASRIFVEWLREIQERLSNALVEDYPLELLAPLLRRLKPVAHDLEFAEDVCVRLLRLQRIRGSRYHDWLFQKHHSDTALSVLASLPDQVAKQSSVILHTRGMTQYKSCARSRPLVECRRRYQSASEDLQLAYERAQQEHRGEQPANVITSHGLLYLGWAKQEQERVNEGGDRDKARRLGETARQYLREGLRLRHDNPYAAYGIAESLVYECEYSRSGLPALSEEEFAVRLAEALDLLELEPEASFIDEWEDLKIRAVALLKGSAATRVIETLNERKDELGVALEALKILGGAIPHQPSEDPDAVEGLRAVWDLLSTSDFTKRSKLADLLRYAIYSAMPERLRQPEYAERFRLVVGLEGSDYLERPIWLYDYGMLALQVGRHRESTEAFRKLRRGARFLEVSLDRGVWYAAQERPTEPRTVTLRILSTTTDGKGWARVEDPKGFIDPVPFQEKIFLAAGSPTRPGAVVRARLRIRPSGPNAEPLRIERNGRR